jgi:hypothetical protein
MTLCTQNRCATRLRYTLHAPPYIELFVFFKQPSTQVSCARKARESCPSPGI